MERSGTGVQRSATGLSKALLSVDGVPRSLHSRRKEKAKARATLDTLQKCYSRAVLDML